MLSIKQGGIKYHFLSLWYDSTWDWTLVSWAIGEHSHRQANGPVKILINKATFFLTEYTIYNVFPYSLKTIIKEVKFFFCFFQVIWNIMKQNHIQNNFWLEWCWTCACFFFSSSSGKLFCLSMLKRFSLTIWKSDLSDKIKGEFFQAVCTIVWWYYLNS